METNMIRLQPEEFDEILQQAKDEEWTELCLIGLHSQWFGSNSEHWPDTLKKSPKIFLLTLDNK